MRNYCKKTLSVCLILFVLILFGCGDSNTSPNNQIVLDYGDYQIEYNGKVSLEKIDVDTDDISEVAELYQEISSDTFKDSLLIAERYAEGQGINTLAQGNLDVLENQGLVLSDIEKKQILIKKKGNSIDCVLIQYEITEGFNSNVPVLYVSQLFVPKGENIILFSYITEDRSVRNSVSDMFANIS